MTETLQDRWRRMHAAGMVRWMSGMRGTHRWVSGFRVLCDQDGEAAEEYVVRPGPDGNQLEVIHECGVMGSFPDGDGSAYPFVPDFTDPATLGCLLELAREALDDPTFTPLAENGLWLWDFTSRDFFNTEAEALLDAIERAAGA